MTPRPPRLQLLLQLALLVCPALLQCATLPTVNASPPPLDSLASPLLPRYVGRDAPQISNFVGSLGCDHSDILAVNSFTVPPWVQGASFGQVTVNGVSPNVTAHQWAPYEARRTATLPNTSANITSTVRMPFEGSGVLLQLQLHLLPSLVPTQQPPQQPTQQPPGALNTTTTVVHVQLQPLIRQLADIPWVYKFPTSPGDFTSSIAAPPTQRHTLAAPLVVTTDHHSAAVTAVAVASVIGGAGTPTVTVTASGTPGVAASLTVAFQGSKAMAADDRLQVQLVLAVGNHSSTIQQRAAAWASNFTAVWAQARSGWQRRWADAFTPGNAQYSGHLPTLQAPSDPGLTAPYYAAVGTLLSMQRTNLPLLGARNVYLTAAGNSVFQQGHVWEIGGAAQYFWDTSFHAILLTLLDPVAFRQSLVLVLSGDFRHCNGIDLMSGEHFGDWYAFNAYSIFTSVSEYIKYSGDDDFLHLLVSNHTVSTWLELLALEWQQYTTPASPYLADYGGNPDNFLECVPTYIHVVPALQAANAWMMSSVASLRRAQGNSSRAEELDELASHVTTSLLETLYFEQGGGPSDQGFYGCLYPNGTLVQVRHIVDFNTIAYCVHGAISGARAEAMAGFFELQLATPHWLHALSPHDPVGFISRPDHGTTGAYAAWPALAMEALALLHGNWSAALRFLRGTALVAHLGPYGQATELPGYPPVTGQPLPPGAPPQPFKTRRGLTRFTADAGGSFAEVTVRSVFGLQPPWLWDGVNASALLFRPQVSRGINATLANVLLPGGGGSCDSVRRDSTITASWDNGLRIAVQDVGGG